MEKEFDCIAYIPYTKGAFEQLKELFLEVEYEAVTVVNGRDLTIKKGSPV